MSCIHLHVESRVGTRDGISHLPGDFHGSMKDHERVLYCMFMQDNLDIQPQTHYQLQLL